MSKFDFSGWATKNNLRCSDGRTIMPNAFKHNDGQKVPLVWNHQHNDAMNILGHALLENKQEGVYAYCLFNDTESGKNAKQLVEHGDVSALSIFANGLRQQGQNVIHGAIREVSLVLAGANPGAFIDAVICHGETSDEEAIIYTGENISMYHSEGKTDTKEETVEDIFNSMTEKQKNVCYALIGQALESEDDDDNNNKEAKHSAGEETVEDIFNSMNEKQKNVCYAMIGQALEENNNDESEGGTENMKHNIFDQTNSYKENTLSHSDGVEIVALAKNKGVGSLQNAIGAFVEDNESLAHGFEDIDTLFPDFKNMKPGAPELITDDMGWVARVMQKTHKSPISRIRTRQTDIRETEAEGNIRGRGYVKGAQKTVAGNVKLLSRTTDPQTVYRKDALHRDDIIDITDFDVVQYQYGIMKTHLKAELARAIMIGDGRAEGDADKIDETHIRSIWHDDELYTIHADVDIEAARTEIQGTNTNVYFGENYIYAEAIIAASLHSRESYKGSGALDFYCTPHLLNVMLLARDRNGRRIYDSKADLAAALNVNSIQTVEQFENKTRIEGTGSTAKTKKLLGIFVNLADYNIGATKGGEITNFNQFDIDFNQEKYLIETRVSGALTKIKSAIVLEEDVTPEPEEPVDNQG